MKNSAFLVIVLLMAVCSAACTSDDGAETTSLPASSITVARGTDTNTNVQSEIEALNSDVESLQQAADQVAELKTTIQLLSDSLDELSVTNSQLQSQLTSALDEASAAGLQAKQASTATDENALLLQQLGTALDDLSDEVLNMGNTFDQKLASPRNCPAGLIPLSDSTCVEAHVRAAAPAVAAGATCYDAGLRPCSASEVVEYCQDPSEPGLEDPFTTTGEWMGDVGGQYLQVSHSPSWIALGHPTADSNLVYCASVRLVGTESSEGATYPYRCCYDRL